MEIATALEFILDAMRLYWLQYAMLIMGVTVLTLVQIREASDENDPPSFQSTRMAWAGVACSFFALMGYYMLVHLYFPLWTGHLDIASKLHWLEFVEGGEVLVKLLGLLLPIIYFLWADKKGTLLLLHCDQANINRRAVAELFLITLVIAAVIIFTMLILIPESKQMIVGNSGLAYANLQLNVLVAIGAILGTEVYFRRLLLEQVLNVSGPGGVIGIGAIWGASALFLTVTWPYLLTALIISGGATWLYIRWRSVTMCMSYQILLTIPAIAVN